jgi:predicted DNA-binding protein with PD1-like motif
MLLPVLLTILASATAQEVPPSVALETRFERVIIVRCKNGTDLLAELQKQTKAKKITNAVILGGFGSVTSSHYHVVDNATIPAKDAFVKDPAKPADILNMQGAILNGKVHAHLTLAGKGPAYGGHLEPDTKVFTFAIVTLGILPASDDIKRFDDQHWR